MIKNISFFILFISSFLTFSQSDFCDKNFGDSYFPLEIGFEKNITWYTSAYHESISEKIEKQGKEYYKYLQDFGNGNAPELILRNSNDTIYSFYKNKESIFLIIKPEVGLEWKGGTIIDTNGKFESPYCYYENLLVVEHKYTNGEKGLRYYKKGLGLVAIKKKKKEIIGMCIPNKEERLKLYSPVSFKGCENTSKDGKISNCTMDSIHEIVIEKLKTNDFKTPKENGTLTFKIHISKEGKVSKVQGLNSIKGGKDIKKLIIKTLEELPKFNPSKTAEKKYVGTKMDISIPINIE
ncbi:hypothetical protein [Tenacibaculum finnmarkense]|uniref:hypothetical protein n=1 Tax=Tenacibaculum finnmarkense TaxID=2781243 RepID=UPI001EFAC575|nr:hypothetical protein [Tenacibaculum finnmarkense]MCG8860043.1 hypothetical protein [Tenacibaculum finnmarkense]